MPLGAYPPMLRRRRQRSAGLGSTTGTSVFAGAGSLVSVAVQRGTKATHRTRRYGVGDADEASKGSRGPRW